MMRVAMSATPQDKGQRTPAARRVSIDMKSRQQLPGVPPNTFDFFRLSKSKSAVDLAPNTIRAYAKIGLSLRKVGRACFVSRSELERFILTRSTLANPSRPNQ
jgi:hypothetical protein